MHASGALTVVPHHGLLLSRGRSGVHLLYKFVETVHFVLHANEVAESFPGKHAGARDRFDERPGRRRPRRGRRPLPEPGPAGAAAAGAGARWYRRRPTDRTP